MRRNHLLLLMALAATLFACQPESPVNPSGYDVGSGVFVLNEGNFHSTPGTLSFYDPVADTVSNNLFEKVNGIPLGDVAQSLAMADGQLYVVVNNSNCIWKMNARTLVCDSAKPYIGDFCSPREMHFVAPNKAYVSDLYGSQLWIVNPVEMTHVGSIEMGKATEKIVQVGNELYVSNWSNTFVQNVEKNTVQVVDINNDVKVAEITVGKEPNTMAVDKNGHVWVLCEGATWEADGENPSLWEIDPQLKTATKRHEFDGTALCVRANPSGDQLYVVNNNAVRRFDVAAMAFSESFLIEAPSQGMFYNMAVEPVSGDVYVADAKNYNMRGSVYRYSSDGVLLASFTTGIIPSAMLFK